MKRTFYLSLFLFFLSTTAALAQQPTSGGAPPAGGFPGGGAPGGGKFNPAQMNIGRFYGKVVDEKGKGVGYATVQLYGMKFDTVAKRPVQGLISGQITEDNGDFSLEKLPIVGEFTLKISLIGSGEVERKVSFGIKPPTPGAGGPPAGGPPAGGFGGGFPGGGGSFEKDLGNIELAASSVALQGVEVTAQAATTTLALDKKVYRVDKDAVATGGNAQDALKNVPSLSVDLDGNVSLRNGAPQIFVDGRPTTLSLDQIAADAIESVEVITNPSAKFDAGGGTAGIINIVLKKEKRLGYNGNVRAGTDTRGGFNLGGDLNARGGKFNLFGSGMFNQNRGYSRGETYRDNLTGTPLTSLTQITDGRVNGLFANARAGVDWLVDNRNTLTLSGNFTRGKFRPSDEINTNTDYLWPDTSYAVGYVRESQQDRNFRNLGTSVQFKHLFPKEGAEWTADLNYNRVRFLGGSDFTTRYDNGVQSIENQDGKGRGQFITFQSDVVNPLKNGMKLEAGVRANMRRNRNETFNSFYDQENEVWVLVPAISDRYKFRDDVFAGYGQFSQQFKNWGYQAGLRAESSIYTGSLLDRDSSFTIAYPISLFPSVFLTRKLNASDQIQFAYTRRINRPNFFQTMPFTDFSDSLNLRRGNPALRPEFVNSVEVSYQNVFSKGHNLLVSVYFKNASNLITSYLTTEYNADLGRDVVVTTFANANSSQAYGAEFTLKNNLFKRLDLTTNLNLYQSRLDADNVAEGLVVDRLSWFLKENAQLKLPAGFTFQASGEYRSRASYTPSSGQQQPWGPQTINTAQGYTRAIWFVDLALKKDILHNKGTLTLSCNDIFRSRRGGTFTESSLFVQETWSYRDSQIFRLNFSYRFGKMDTSLFRRKNMKQSMQGNDMM